jgi:hypothetical protein
MGQLILVSAAAFWIGIERDSPFFRAAFLLAKFNGDTWGEIYFSGY